MAAPAGGGIPACPAAQHTTGPNGTLRLSSIEGGASERSDGTSPQSDPQQPRRGDSRLSHLFTNGPRFLRLWLIRLVCREHQEEMQNVPMSSGSGDEAPPTTANHNAAQGRGWMMMTSTLRMAEKHAKAVRPRRSRQPRNDCL